MQSADKSHGFPKRLYFMKTQKIKQNHRVCSKPYANAGILPLREQRVTQNRKVVWRPIEHGDLGFLTTVLQREVVRAESLGKPAISASLHPILSF